MEMYTLEPRGVHVCKGLRFVPSDFYIPHAMLHTADVRV